MTLNIKETVIHDENNIIITIMELYWLQLIIDYSNEVVSYI